MDTTFSSSQGKPGERSGLRQLFGTCFWSSQTECTDGFNHRSHKNKLDVLDNLDTVDEQWNKLDELKLDEFNKLDEKIESKEFSAVFLNPESNQIFRPFLPTFETPCTSQHPVQLPSQVTSLVLEFSSQAMSEHDAEISRQIEEDQRIEEKRYERDEQRKERTEQRNQQSERNHHERNEHERNNLINETKAKRLVQTAFSSQTSFSSLGTPPSQKVTPKKKRSKKGCWICRARHKSCCETRPVCANCAEYKLVCDYSRSRPSYMTDNALRAAKLEEIKEKTLGRRGRKGERIEQKTEQSK